MRIIIALVLLMPLASAFAFDENFDVKGLQPLSPYGVFSTFSAESLKQNTVDTSLEFERVRKPNFYRSTMKLAYGLHDRFEIEFTLPYVEKWDKHINGLEDANFGIKHRVLDEGLYNPAIAYMLTVATPSGSDDFSTEGAHGGGLLLTKKVGPFKGHLNFLYEKPGDSTLHRQFNVNIGAELAVSHDSKILAELVGRKDYFKNKLNLLEWRLGYRIATLDNLFTTLGAGFNIKNRTPDYRLLFSVSIILPKEKIKLEKIYE
jgi:hypothetical protein